MLKYFWQYYWRAQTRFRIHSPFVYQLVDKVIEDDRQYYIFDALAKLRGQLLQKHEAIEILDLGAGSRKKQDKHRKVRDIVRHSVSPQWQCQLLFRLVNFLQAEYRLEIGSSIGLSSLYQFFPNQQAPFITLEGSPELAKLARQNFTKMDATGLQLLEGPFEDTLPAALQKLGQLDYAFIDGNHAKEPTLRYFEACLPYIHAQSVLVFDDIYWSDEMAKAWETIKSHPKVTLTIDLFWAGLVFFRDEQKEPQHLTHIAHKYKPWQLGIFK